MFGSLAIYSTMTYIVYITRILEKIYIITIWDTSFSQSILLTVQVA